MNPRTRRRSRSPATLARDASPILTTAALCDSCKNKVLFRGVNSSGAPGDDPTLIDPAGLRPREPTEMPSQVSARGRKMHACRWFRLVRRVGVNVHVARPSRIRRPMGGNRGSGPSILKDRDFGASASFKIRQPLEVDGKCNKRDRRKHQRDSRETRHQSRVAVPK